MVKKIYWFMDDFVVVCGVFCLIFLKYFDDLFQVKEVICKSIEVVFKKLNFEFNFFVWYLNRKCMKNIGIFVLIMVDLFYVQVVLLIEIELCGKGYWLVQILLYI